MTKAYDAYKTLEGAETFEAWVRLGGAAHVVWMRKLANGIGHASFGKKLHAFQSELDGELSFCRKHEASRCTNFRDADVLPPDACSSCWEILKLWWSCGRFE